MPGKRKRELIIAYRDEHHLERAGLGDIQQIQAALLRTLGPGARTSPAYIAQVLRDRGTSVEYDSLFLDPEIPEPYAAHLKDALHFSDLSAAESSIRRLDAAYRGYSKTSDRTGMNLVRSLVRKGKLRADRMAASPRVSEAKRREKAEIAGWFRIWLESPDIFFDWLALRKQTPEFQDLSGAASEQTN